jgi:hypothetical protein
VLSLALISNPGIAEDQNTDSGPVTIQGQSPVIFAPQSTTAINDGCIAEIFGRFGNGQDITCQANDVRISAVTNVIVAPGDGCDYVGDTVKFSADYEILLGASGPGSSRHDIGIYLGTDGSARDGNCLVDILPTGPDPFYTDLDGFNDDTDTTGYCFHDPKQPCNTAIGDTDGDGDQEDCEIDLDGDGNFGGACIEVTAGNLADTCGDIDQDPNPITHTILDLEIVCVDTDGDGLANLPNCTSWRQPGGNDLCLSPLFAFPGAPSKCRCESINVTGIPVPKTIEIVKNLVPATDLGVFDLDLDGGAVETTDAGDGGATGPLVVQAGTHSVSEFAGTDTDLSHYDTSIYCEDRVGRCVSDSTVHCIDDFTCDILDDGNGNDSDTCTRDIDGNIVATPVASCSSCTTIDVDVPDLQTQIVCTITNTNKCLNNSCDNGDACDGLETCEPTDGSCVAGTSLVCDDDNPCNGLQRSRDL